MLIVYATFSAAVGNSLYQLLVVQAFRPDRVLAMVHKVVETVFGQSFTRTSEQELDLALIVDKEVQCNLVLFLKLRRTIGTNECQGAKPREINCFLVF